MRKRTVGVRGIGLFLAVLLTALEPGRALAQAVSASPVRVSIPSAPLVGANSSLPVSATLPALPVLPSAAAGLPLLPAPLTAAAAVSVAPPSARVVLAQAVPASAKAASASAASQSHEASRAFDGFGALKSAAAETAGTWNPSAAALPRFQAAPTSALKALPAPSGPVRVLSWRERLRALRPAALIALTIGGAAGVLHALGLDPVLATPLIGMAGSLLPSGKPDPETVAQLLWRLGVFTPAGTKISTDTLGTIILEMGLSPDDAGRVIAALAEQGHVAMRANRDLLLFSFAGRAKGDPLPGSSLEADGDSAAAESVRLLNRVAALDHLRSVAFAEKAVALYAQAEARGKIAQAEEARVLRDNAVIEAMTSLLEEHAKDLRDAPDSRYQVRLDMISSVLTWLRDATQQVGRPNPMPAAIRADLLVLIGSLNPTAADKKAADEAADGYIAVLSYLENANLARFAPAPAQNAQPSPVDEARYGRFLAGLRRQTEVLTRITKEAMLRAADGLGADTGEINEFIQAAARRGGVQILNNGIALLVDLSALTPAQPDSPVGQALKTATFALTALNSADPRAHVRAVSDLNAVREELLPLAKTEFVAEVLRRVNAVLANARLEVLDHALRVQEKALAEALANGAPFWDKSLTPEALGERLSKVRQALEWLSTAYFATKHDTNTPREVAVALPFLFNDAALRHAYGADYRAPGIALVRAYLDHLSGLATRPHPADGSAPLETAGGWKSLEKGEYPALFQFGTDLTRSAAEGKLMPLIGRKAELRQAVKTLLRLKKNNPIFIGEPGVGKTVMAEGLAQAIVNGDIPDLQNKNIVKLDMTKIVAGTSLRGQFEERMAKIMAEVKRSEGRVILFIDEIHTIIGAGDSEGATDAANILKEALADGSISLMGSTTLEEFRRIEKDAALARRFNKITLVPPTKDEAIQIVEGVKKFYEKHHGVTASAATVKSLVEFAARYITDRQLPDSPLDLLDDASAEVRVKRSEAEQAGKDGPGEVLVDDIAFEIAQRTGIPVGKIGADEREQLKNLPKELGAQVIGQDEAVTKVAKGVQRGRLGMKNAKQPTGAFVFLGPTGVGKTEIARATAKVVFGSEKNMVRLDMSEYQEEHSVSRLFGAPPGYVGHEDAGQLTEKIRRQPYSVILLDEIEKAHPKVMDALLQVLEDGRLTDGQGKTVDFSNTIIMMTSNLGGSLSGEEKKDEEPRRRMGFATAADEPASKTPAADEDPAARRKRYMDALRAKYRPEFINRIGEDAVIVFNELGEAQLKDILELRIRDLQNQLKDKNVTLELTAGARAEVLRRAVEQKAYGARPLKQTLERQVSDAVSEAYLEGVIVEGDAVTVDWNAAKSAFVASKKRP